MLGAERIQPANAGSARRYLVQRIGFAVLVVAALLVVIPILFVIVSIIVRGSARDLARVHLRRAA